MNGMEKPMRQFVRLAPLPRVIKSVLKATACIGALAMLSTGANAGAVTPDQATRMYNRIAGIPPTPAELAQMLAATSAVDNSLCLPIGLAYRISG